MAKPDRAMPCKRPPLGTSKGTLLGLHKGKMMGKYFRNLETSRVGLTPVNKKVR